MVTANEMGRYSELVDTESMIKGKCSRKRQVGTCSLYWQHAELIKDVWGSSEMAGWEGCTWCAELTTHSMHSLDPLTHCGPDSLDSPDLLNPPGCYRVYDAMLKAGWTIPISNSKQCVCEPGVTVYLASQEIWHPHSIYPRIFCTPLGYLATLMS